jgi:hypothetical protein
VCVHMHACKCKDDVMMMTQDEMGRKHLLVYIIRPPMDNLAQQEIMATFLMHST